jgi:AAA ATPase domain
MVGRDEELAVVGAVLSRAAGGDGGALVVRGEAGIGKSTMLDAARQEALVRGMAVVTTVGGEIETGLPYAGLHRLLMPLLEDMDRLEPLHRGVLRAALGLGDQPPGEPLLVSRALLALLSSCAERRPLLVVADDVQWLDRPSREALAYVGRHAAGRPLLVLTGLREGYEPVGEEPGLAVLPLGGLAPRAAARLLDTRAATLTQPVRRRLLDEAAGNPLALVELPLADTAEAAADELTLLPISARLEHAFAGRLKDLPERTRATLLVAACDETSTLDEVFDAVAHLDGRPPPTRDVLGPAVVAQLVSLDGDQLRHRHPLVRSAVYQAASPARRRAAHAALAAVLAHGDDVDRRTWHRAAATERRDDDVADAVEAVAERARARGAVLDAAVTLRRAAELTTDARRQGRRLLACAELAYEAGHADMVQTAVKNAQRLSLDTRDRARAALLSEIFHDGVAGDVSRVHTLVDDARQVVELGDVDLALQLLQGAAVRCWWAALGADVRGVALAGAEAVPIPEHDPRLLAIVGCVAPLERGADVVERLPRALEEADGDPLGTWFAAVAAHAVGDHRVSRRILAGLAPVLRAQGRFGLLTQVLSMLQWDGVMLGDWATTKAAAAEGDRLARETGQRVWGAGLTCGLAAAAAVVHDDAERAQRLTAEAEAVIVPHGLADQHSLLVTARGIAAASAGRHRDAFVLLSRLFDQRDPAFHYREQFGGLSFYAEAAAQCGRTRDASATIGALDADTRGRAAPALRASIAFARALLDAPDRSPGVDEARLSPFDGARLRQARGRWLLAEDRPGEAADELDRAEAGFAAAGAHAWVARVRGSRVVTS